MAVPLAGVEDRKTDTGTMKISSAPLAALDLLRYPQASGGFDNVATDLAELAPAIEPDELASLCTRVERSVVQRLSYLPDWLGADRLAQPVLEALRSKAPPRWIHRRESPATRTSFPSHHYGIPSGVS